MKLWRKGLTVALSACLMAAVFAGTAMAKEERTKITKVDLTVDSDIAPGDDSGDVSVTATSGGNYRVTDVEIVNDEGEWTVGDKPKIEVTLEADSDYYFDSMSKSKVKLRGDDASYTGSRREDSSSTLILKLTLDALEGNMEIDEQYWEDDNSPIAQWEDTDGAKSYQVRLYRGSSSVGESVTTTNSYYNFSSKITRTGEYYFKVRAVNSNSKKGEWYESDYLYVDDELLSKIQSGTYNNVSNNSTTGTNTSGTPGTTSAQWVKNNVGWWYRYADGTYPANGWLQINGIWYCFDSVGYMRTGWIQAGNAWYYCDASGAMLTNTTTPDGFKVDANGVWVQ